ncbi:carboxypeptidase-like regulatory domain-containing protein [Longimicrobium sp.]|uniref:carboxypeptidase-like regulatory domain-containing protein n=1 Tax=Longimicrobium sp. TaxID=2029185 RepID=UPI002E376879|nr:carboxypeptidase-like regulatory domain-containing protein [Longimicrobium sp.]HEX6037804.1 carboxypeptidase-like regulatory domain-containing protein [Longimicrobium sp.]
MSAESTDVRPAPRRRRVPAYFAGALALLLVVSCTNPMCGCPPLPPPHAVLYGRVTDPAGTPVQGAAVALEGAETGCNGPGTVGARVLTGADGMYRLPVWISAEPMGVCLRAHAAPPSGRELWASDTIQVRPLFGAEPADSARADFRLRAIWP